MSHLSSVPEIDVSIKAVNGRFLEIRFHSPREYGFLEGELKAILSRSFARGTIDVYINRNRQSVARPSIAINLGLARAWIEGYRRLAGEMRSELGSAKPAQEPDLDLLARVPDLFQVRMDDVVGRSESELVRKLFAEAVTACDHERSREGAALKTELIDLCQRLERMVAVAETLKSHANAELERRLQDRLNDQLKRRGLDGKIDEQRIANEIVILLDRADISEELQRLREHLKAYQKLLKVTEPQGKKLDFYAQELLREINTIGSKSHVAKLTQAVVEAKTVVEKIREQIQNVE